MPRYKAARPIYLGWALAYNTGDWVHEQTVAEHGWADPDIDPPLVEEVPDDPLPPAAPAVFVEPSAGDEPQPESEPARPELDTADAVAEQEAPTSKPAANRRSQK